MSFVELISRKKCYITIFSLVYSRTTYHYIIFVFLGKHENQERTTKEIEILPRYTIRNNNELK